MQGVGEGEGRGDDEGALFGIGKGGGGSSPLTAVMHGVAGYDHRRGHGDGGAAHGELVGDGVIRTAAAKARLARRGSWRNSNIWVISRLRKRGPSGRQVALVPGNVLLGLFGGKPTLDYSCAHDGAHPGVGVVYDPCVHWNQPEKKK